MGKTPLTTKALHKFIGWRVRVAGRDGRFYVGILATVDRHLNLILAQCEELRTESSAGAQKALADALAGLDKATCSEVQRDLAARDRHEPRAAAGHKHDGNVARAELENILLASAGAVVLVIASFVGAIFTTCLPKQVEKTVSLIAAGVLIVDGLRKVGVEGSGHAHDRAHVRCHHDHHHTSSTSVPERQPALFWAATGVALPWVLGELASLFGLHLPSCGGQSHACRSGEASASASKDGDQTSASLPSSCDEGGDGYQVENAAAHLREGAAITNLLVEAAHNFTDGLVLGASVGANRHALMPTTLALLAHEVPGELADFPVLRRAGLSTRDLLKLNCYVALPAVPAAVLGCLATETVPIAAMKALEALVGGSFVAIGACVLLPASAGAPLWAWPIAMAISAAPLGCGHAH